MKSNITKVQNGTLELNRFFFKLKYMSTKQLTRN